MAFEDIVAGEFRQAFAERDGALDESLGRLIGGPEGKPRQDEVFGHVRGFQIAVAHRRAHAGGIGHEGGHQDREGAQGADRRVLEVEERFLVLLQVAVVRVGQALLHDEEGLQAAEDAR